MCVGWVWENLLEDRIHCILEGDCCGWICSLRLLEGALTNDSGVTCQQTIINQQVGSSKRITLLFLHWLDVRASSCHGLFCVLIVSLSVKSFSHLSAFWVGFVSRAIEYVIGHPCNWVFNQRDAMIKEHLKEKCQTLRLKLQYAFFLSFFLIWLQCVFASSLKHQIVVETYTKFSVQALTKIQWVLGQIFCQFVCRSILGHALSENTQQLDGLLMRLRSYHQVLFSSAVLFYVCRWVMISTIL